MRNTSSRLAFFTRLRLLNAQKGEILPAQFSDNYISLLPGEGVEVVLRDARVSTRQSLTETARAAAAAEVEATTPRGARATLRL